MTYQEHIKSVCREIEKFSHMLEPVDLQLLKNHLEQILEDVTSELEMTSKK